MARLKVPGRPGSRIGRLRVPYSTDGHEIESDPTFRYITHVQNGLQEFRELFGDSDEEEFLGFTDRDVKKAERKLQMRSSPQKAQGVAQQRQLRKKIAESISAMADDGLVEPVEVGPTLVEVIQPSSRAARLKERNVAKKQSGSHTLDKSSAAKGPIKKGTSRVSARTSKVVKIEPTSRRRVGRPRKNDLASDFVDQVIEQQVKEAEQPEESVEELDNKNVADSNPESDLDTRSLRSRKVENSPLARRPSMAKTTLSKITSVHKGHGQQRAKMLLERAKRTGAKKEKSPKATDAVEVKTGATAPERRKFHLPATSSRSSRKIIPNKRFLLEEKIGSATFARSPKIKENVQQSSSGECILELGCVSQSTSCGTSVPCGELSTSTSSMGLLDQPLIVDGKRERKPSVKLIQKLSEGYIPERKSPCKSPEKFSRRERRGVELERDLRAKQRSGKTILQKAKFRLNQAALNRSKAALACSLKKQMRKEDRQLRKALSKEAVPPSTSFSSSPPEQKLFSHFGLKPTPSLVLSPLKFGLSAAASEPVVFGASSLPAVPKFALESTTESLPTFQSPNRGKGLDPVEKKVASPFKHDDSHVQEMMKERYGYICPICTDKLSCKLKYYGVYCCRSCARFYRARILDLADSGEEPICSENGNCVMSAEKKFNNCHGCRFVHCKKVFPKPQNIRELHRMLKVEGGKLRLTADSKSGSEEKFSPKAVKRGDQSTKAKKSKISSEASSEDSKVLIADESAETCSTELQDLAEPSASLRALLANKSPIKTEDESNTQDCMQAVNELISAPPVNQGDVKLSEPVTPSSSSVIPIQTPSPGQGVGATQHTPGSDGTATSPRRVPTHGPRIKHVCRRAAVALGTPATFPSPDSVTLSALPTMEKQKILSDREKEDRPGTPDSDDMSLDEIIRQAKDESFEMSPNKKTPNRAFKALVPRGFKTSPDKRMNAPDIVTGRRRIRCNKCAGCNSKDCGKCVNCRDKPKFGGEGKLKQACMKKKCSNPQLRDKPGRLTPPSNAPKPRKIIIEQDAHPGAQNRKLPVETYSRGLAQSSNSRPPGRFSKTSILAPSPKKGNKPMAKAYGMKNKYLSGELAGRIINADFKENYDIDVAWLRGLALISSTPMCVRTVCLLCGSAGQEELIFCNICCEPFHTFCLDPGEAPKQENIENWCCRRCQFCHVCGRQNNDKGIKELLQCNKCQETYHPGCLGSNYPTKPSKKKKIWVCTKCVRCKSCGATTPGHSQNATWMYDFSLCYECGILMDKGNYCPVCHKCYSDDDWESKMIQCATCQCWVHSKCEEMSDEMYQVFSYLPEDITFNCRVCRPERPPPWLQILKKELEAGFSIIIDTILAYKCSVHLERISEKLVDTDPKTTDMKIKAITSSSTTIESKPSSERTSIVQDDKTTPKTEDQSEKADVPMDTETVSESDHNPAASAQEDKQPSRISEKNRLEDESAKEQTNPSCMDTGTANQQDCNTKLDDKVNTDDIDPGKSSAPATSEDGREQGRENKGASEQAANEPTNVTQSEGELPPPSGETTQKCDEGGSGNAEELPDTVSTPTLESQPCDINPEDAQHPGSAFAETSQNPIANKEPQSMNISNTSSCTDSAPETSAIMDVGDTPTASLKGDVNDLTQEQVDKSKNMLEEKKDFPRDFQSVRKKLNNREYKNVDEFIEDIGRIIQHNMQLEEIPIVRKKACNTIRSSFIKTIGQCFPWFNIKSTLLWGNDKNLPSNMLPDAVIPPYADHEYAQWLHREETPMSPQPSPFKKVIATPRKIAIPIMASFDDDAASSAPSEPPDIGQIGDDTRRCLLCGQSGDESPDESGRMLYAGQDDWVHINCALWSAEVYEEVDGTLQRVQNAMARGKKMKCDHCQKAGATVGCCQSGCHANYHFKCAKVRECLFQEDKKVYCKQHFYSVDTEVIQDNKFAVQRRACIEQDPSKSIKRTWQRGLCSDLINIVIGSMTVENLGKLGLLSDRKNALCPVNYCVTRVFWSTVDPRRRCIYTCRIIEVNPMEEEIDIVMKDITVIHEESHPDYDGDKVKQLMEAAQRISTRKSRLEKEEKSEKERRTRHGVGDCKYTKCDEYFIDDSPAPKKSAAKMKQVSRGSSNAPKKSGLGIPYQPSEKGGPLQGMPYQPAVLLPESSLSQLPKNRPSAIQIWKEKNLGGMKLAKSWPGTAVSSPTSSAPPLPEPRPKSLPDLRGLSPATVKLLGQTDLSKFKQTSKSMTDCANDLVLGKIADRLNTAAAKNKTTKQTVNTPTHREGSAEKPVPTCEAGTISTLPMMALPPPVERLVGPVRTCGLLQNPEPMQLGEGEQTKTIPQVDGMIDSSSDSECDSSDTDFWDSSLPQVDGKYDDKSKNENNGLTTEGRVTRRMSNGPLKVPNTDNSKSYGNAPGSSENNSNLDQHKIDSRIKVDKEHIENFELQFGKAKVVLEPTNIPLHDKIAQKIKAESLARSSPSEQGPFKCNKCKRLYRTKESCEKHAETCTFEVSTDEEDEEEEDEQEGDSPSRPIRVEIFQQTPEADSRQRHTRSGGERTTSPRRNRSKSTKRKFEHEEATETGSTSSPPGKKLKASKHGPDGESAEFCVPIKNQVPIVSIVPIRTSDDGISFEDAAGVRSAQNNSNRRSTRSARNNTVTSGDLMSSRPEIDCNNAPPQQTNEKAASNENTDDAGNTDGTLVNGNCESAVVECENSEIAGPSSTQSCGTESVRSDSLTPVIDNSARGPQSVPLFHPEKETILSSFPSSSVIRLDHQKPPTKTAVIAPLPPAEGRNVLTVESVAPKVPGSMCDALIGQNVNPSPALVDATVATLHTQSRHVDGGGDAVQGVPPSVQNLANSSACESQSNENADERNQGKPEKKNKSPPKKKSPTKSLSPSKISPKGPPGMDKLVQMQIISQGPNQPSTVRILPKVVSSPPPVQQTFVEQPIVPSQLKQFASPSGQMGYVGSYINADGISQSVTILPQSQIVSGVAPNMALQQNVRGIQVIQPGVMNIGGVTQQQLQQVLVSSNGNQILTSVSLAAPVSIASHVNCTGGLIGSPAAGLGSAVVQATPLYDQTLVQQPLPTVQANLAEQQVVSPPLVQPSIGVPTHRTILTNQMGATILSQPGLRTGTMNIHTVQSNAFPQPQLLGIRPSTAVGQTTSVQTIQGNTTAAQMLKDLVSQKAVSISHQSSNATTQALIAGKIAFSSSQVASGATSNTTATVSSAAAKPVQRNPLPITTQGNINQLVAMTPAGVPSVKYHQGMLSHADMNPKVRLKRLSPKRKSPKNSPPKRNQPQKQSIIVQKRKQIIATVTDVNELKKKKFESSLEESIRQSLKATIMKKTSEKVIAPQTKSVQQQAEEKVRVAHAQGIELLKKQQQKIAGRVLKDNNKVLAKKSRKDPMKNLRKDVGHAHPLIHPTHQSAFLPVAALEEEVEDSPLLAAMMEEEERRARENRKKNSPYLMFEITSDDGFKCKAESYDEAWKMVTDKVADARSDARMKQLSFSGVNGLSMFGLSHDAIIFLLEQLTGAETCKHYQFRFHEYERREVEEEPEVNPSGCARAEPFISRRPFEMFSFLLSKYRDKPTYVKPAKGESEISLKPQRRTTSMDLPMAMRYRHLRSNAREAVGVYRSGIHGRGLFCKRNIDAGEMVIEYAGEVIRGILTDKRENYYESKGIGCYMFRIDDDDVVDATVNGNSARFINHSCDPNCYSKVIQVDNQKHIVIFAQRPIKRGEELTYDYKFPIEEVKIPCTCAAKRCRKFLN